MTRFYRFPDAQTALNLLGIDTGKGHIIPCDQRYGDGRYVAIDVINGNGVITHRIGGTDEEPITETLDGYHVNVTGSDTPEIAAFEVSPANPVCVFA